MAARRIPIDFRKIRLTKEERQIERESLRGDYVPVAPEEFERIKAMIAETVAELERRRKDAVLNIRVNSQDMARIKQKAKKLGVPYQTFLSEMIHHLAAD